MADEIVMPEYDAVVVGAGFSGLKALHELRGRGLKVVLLEAADGVGGVWHWNRYPGARVDTNSLDYSYSFSPELHQEWTWTERFAGQPELERYFQFVVERFDLARDIRLSTHLAQADFDESNDCWALRLEPGEQLTTRHLVMGTGILSAPLRPAIPGIDDFARELVHTGKWPKGGVDVAGKRVAVIGTGSSGVQIVPELAQEAGELFVFQRTANHIVPSQNRAITAAEADEFRAHAEEYRARAATTDHGLSLWATLSDTFAVTEAEREAEYERRWQLGGFDILHVFQDIHTDLEANRSLDAFLRRKILEIVTDPAVAEKLMPGPHPVATKRISVANGYLEAYNRRNVTLLDASTDPVLRITPRGIETPAGEIELDVIVLATGYDAGTGSMTRIDIRGRGGRLLRDKWAEASDNLLGLATHGFPNFFWVAGHGSGSALSNLPVLTEHHSRWLAELFLHMQAEGLTAIDAGREAELAWGAEVNAIAEATVHGHNKRTWYWGANVPGKPVQFSVYLGGVPTYTARLAALAAAGYAPDFTLS